MPHIIPTLVQTLYSMSPFSVLEIHAVMFHRYVHLKLQASQPGYPVLLRSILWNLQKVDTLQNICSVGYNWTRRLEIIIIDVPWQVKILRAHCDAIFPPPIFRSCRTTNTCSNLAILSNLCSGKIQHIMGNLLNCTQLRSIRSARKQNLLTNLPGVCTTSVSKTAYNFENTRQLKDTIPSEFQVSN